jgi:hypothetical protein
MNGRQFLDEVFNTALPDGWRVIPYDDSPVISELTVMFHRASARALPQAPSGTWESTMTIYVLTPKQDGEPALDALDDALDVVLMVLDGVDGLTWSEATYTVLADTYPTFQITAQVRTQKEATI